MTRINDNFLSLSENYLFSEVAKKIHTYKTAHPDANIIRLGIGDVTLPLSAAVIQALHTAVDEMAAQETFHGYGPEQGYDFLRKAIIDNAYRPNGIDLDIDEVFISDGAKSDLGNIGDILGVNNRVALTDPVYPVYIDTNVMAGRSGNGSASGGRENIIYLPCVPENDFVPELPQMRPDIIYLCYPNNPTGTVLTTGQLKKWVDYALENEVLILFDSAYEAFIRQDDIPHSIYEIEGAKQVAIEFRSFSKTAGFTGLRCGYTIVPKNLFARDKNGSPVSLNQLWLRRQTTKFNGTAYIVQRAAEAVFSPEGKRETAEKIDYYMRNAHTLKSGLTAIGLDVYGGDNAPYIWIKSPKQLSSWRFFDRWLNECNIVGTPGVGFGPSGEGFLRLTAFGKYENTIEAIERLKHWTI